MPGSPQSTPPNLPWDEADAVRETALLYIDDPEDKESMRRLGRLVYNLAVETSRLPFPEPMAHAELRAAVGDLRFLEGFLDSLGRTLEHSRVEPEEEPLIHFAGRMSRRVGRLAKRIEERL